MKKFKLDATGLACPIPVVKTKKLLEEYETVETTVDNFIATQNLDKLAKQLSYNISVTEVGSNYEVVISKNELEKDNIIDTLNDKCVIPVTQAKRVLENNSKVEILVKDESNVDKLEEFAKKNNYNFEKLQKEDHYSVSIEKLNNELEQEKPVQKFDESYIVVINKKIMGHGSEELGKRLIKAYLYALTEQEELPKKIIFYNDGGELVDRNRSHVLDELKELENNGVEIVCCGACIDYHNIDLAVGNPTNMYFIVEDMRKANRIIRP